jgi:hypothetical protein
MSGIGGDDEVDRVDVCAVLTATAGFKARSAEIVVDATVGEQNAVDGFVAFPVGEGPFEIEGGKKYRIGR